LSKDGDALQRHDGTNLQAVIETDSRYTRRLRWSEMTDAVGECNYVSSRRHLEAAMKHIWKYPCRRCSNQVGDVLGG